MHEALHNMGFQIQNLSNRFFQGLNIEPTVLAVGSTDLIYATKIVSYAIRTES